MSKIDRYNSAVLVRSLSKEIKPISIIQYLFAVALPIVGWAEIQLRKWWQQQS